MLLTDAAIEQYSKALSLDAGILKSVLDVKPNNLFLTVHQEYILNAIAMAVRFRYPPADALHAAERLYVSHRMERPDFSAPYLRHADVIAVTEYAARTGGPVMSDDLSRAVLKEFDTNWGRDAACDFGDCICRLPKEYRDVLVRETARLLAKWDGSESYEPTRVTPVLLWHLMSENLDGIWKRLAEISGTNAAGRDLDGNILSVFARRHSSEFYGKYGVEFEDASPAQRQSIVDAVRADLVTAGFKPPERATVLDIQKVLSGPGSGVWYKLSELKSKSGGENA